METSLMAYPSANDPDGLAGVLNQVDAARAAGFGRVWMPQMPPAPGVASWDTLTALAVAGARTPDIGLASGVVIAYSQHPLTLARQALTVAAATGGRFALGVGVGHRAVVSDMLGYSYEAPAAYLREYLEVLGAALAGGPVDHHGEALTAVGQVDLPTAPVPPLLIAALGPRMLDLAGTSTDGTVVTWAGPRVVAERIVPRISTAAAAAGRPSPRIVVGVPVVVTHDADAARDEILGELGQAGDFPAYRAILDVEGADSVADVCLIGDEDAVAARLRQYSEAGATEFVASLHGDPESRARTVDLLRSVAV